MPRPMRMRNQMPEKSKDFTGSMKRLFNNLNVWKYFLVLALIFSMASAIIALITPNKLSDLADTIALGIKPNINEKVITDIFSNPDITPEDKAIFKKMMDEKDQEKMLKNIDKLPESIYEIIKPEVNIAKVKSIALLLVILFVISAMLNYIQALIMTDISNKFAKKLRTNISNKINRLPLKYFDRHEVGDVLSRITNDVDTIAQNMHHSVASFVNNLTIFLGSIIMMFVTNYIMAITAIVATLFGFLSMGFILKRSQKYFTKRQEELGKLNGYIEEMFSNHNVVKAYNGEREANKEFNKLNKNLYKYNKKSQFLSGVMQPIMGFVGNFGYVAVCVVGALLVINGYITFGVIVAFMVYIRMFTNPLSQIAQSMTAFQSIAAASERVFEFLDEEELTDESKLMKKLKQVKGEIEFKNVKFGYNEDKTIIKNFSAKVKPGQKIAIVGPTGAGKTTMVNLLMKFYEINEGDILIDGVSIKDLSREAIHDLFIMVLQDTWLFEGTVKENLKFNNNKVTDKEMLDVCKYIGIDHFIKTLPGGINSKIGENDQISGGEKQLLTIARGMIKNSPFLILDEATSNVDTRTEELVQKAMDKLSKGKTSFIIAHRLSTIKNADLILVMKDGNIIEQGSHKELLKKKGFYSELYNSQFDTLK